MRDVDGGDAELALDAAELELHLLAELSVERGERLVEQQQVRLEDQRAGDGDALLLPAGKLVDAPLAEAAEPDEIEIAVDALRNRARIEAAHFQREGDVLGGAHMREQREPLEHHADRAAVAAARRAPAVRR